MRQAHLFLLSTLLALFATAAAVAGDPPSLAVATEDLFHVPPGADPSVPAALGGAGFEQIAAAEGWGTGAIAPKHIPLVVDTAARKGGTITLSSFRFPATLRTMGEGKNAVAVPLVTGFVYEALIATDPITLKLVAALATHWKVDPDGQTYYYRINPDARFSDGHPVTSEDVIATHMLSLDSSIRSPSENSFSAGFDPPVAVSKYIVKVRSKEKNWKNLLYFGGQAILPAHVIGTMSGAEYMRRFQYEMMPGSGPYIIVPEDMRTGFSLTLTRRSNWWNAGDPVNRHAYNFDKINLLILETRNLAYAAFHSGDLDLMVVERGHDWDYLSDFEEVEKGLIQRRRVFTADAVGTSGLVFNTRHRPLNDVRVRRALAHLVDWDSVFRTLLGGKSLRLNSYYQNSRFANPRNPTINYDTVEAVRLLTEAGYRRQKGTMTLRGRPLQLELIVPSGTERFARLMQESLARGGVRLNLRFVDEGTRADMMRNHHYEIAYQAWSGLVYPNPISVWSSATADKPGTGNITGMKNHLLDSLCVEEERCFDLERRTTILQTIDSVLVAECHYALDCYVPYISFAYWNRFGHPEWYLGRIDDWRSVLTAWWYDPERVRRVEQGEAMKVGPEEVDFWRGFDER